MKTVNAELRRTPWTRGYVSFCFLKSFPLSVAPKSHSISKFCVFLLTVQRHGSPHAIQLTHVIARDGREAGTISRVACGAISAAVSTEEAGLRKLKFQCLAAECLTWTEAIGGVLRCARGSWGKPHIHWMGVQLGTGVSAWDKMRIHYIRNGHTSNYDLWTCEVPDHHCCGDRHGKYHYSCNGLLRSRRAMTGRCLRVRIRDRSYKRLLFHDWREKRTKNRRNRGGVRRQREHTVKPIAPDIGSQREYSAHPFTVFRDCF